MQLIPAEISQLNGNVESSQVEFSESGCEMITVVRTEWIQTRWDANYYKTQFRKARQRATWLKEENAKLSKAVRGANKLGQQLAKQEQELVRLRAELAGCREQLRVKQMECDDLQSRIAGLNKMVFGERSERVKRAAPVTGSWSDYDSAGKAGRRWSA